MSTQTTGHFGNSQPYETLKPKGTVGRLCTAVVNLVTGDAVTVAGQGVIHVQQKGYMPSRTASGDAYTIVKADVPNGFFLEAEQATDDPVTLTLPAASVLLGWFPDLKFGDRYSFPVLVTTTNNGTIQFTGGDDRYTGVFTILGANPKTSFHIRFQLYDNAGTAAVRYWSTAND